MNNNGGYQPAGQTVVVVNTNRRTPQFMQQGVRVGGMMLGLACFVCMGIFAVFFILSGIMMLAFNVDHDDLFEDDSDPMVIIGSIFLVIGVVLLLGGVALCVFARKKYKNLQGDGVRNPGRVINPPPSGHQEQPMTPGYPGQPQPAVYPMQPPPTGYPGHPQPAGYGYPQPVGYGQPQPYGYPGQPQPSGYPAQPLNNPEPTSAYPGPPAPFPQPPSGYASQTEPPYPEKMSVTNVTSEYMPPPPTAPDPSSQPPPYQQ